MYFLQFSVEIVYAYFCVELIFSPVRHFLSSRLW